jgi:hypothetical protein
MRKNGSAEIQGGNKWNTYAMEMNINFVNEDKNGMFIKKFQLYMN